METSSACHCDDGTLEHVRNGGGSWMRTKLSSVRALDTRDVGHHFLVVSSEMFQLCAPEMNWSGEQPATGDKKRTIPAPKAEEVGLGEGAVGGLKGETHANDSAAQD